MMNAEVGVSRLVHHLEYDPRQEMGHVCIRNVLDSRYMESLDLTSYFKNVCLGRHNLVNEFQSESVSSIVTKDFIESFGGGACLSFLHHHWGHDSRQEMGHVCIRNELDIRHMDSLDLTSYFNNVCLGWHNLIKEFQSESDNSIVAKDFIEPFEWGVCHSFLQHDTKGITRQICEKLEDKAKVGQLPSNKVHNAIKFFMDAKHRLILDLWLLPRQKRKGHTLLFCQTLRHYKGRTLFCWGC